MAPTAIQKSVKFSGVTVAPKIKRYASSEELRRWAMDLSNQDRKRLGISDIEVSNRGRFHSKLVSAFNREHRQQGIRYVPIGRDVPKTREAFEDADRGDDDTPTVYREPRQERQEETPPEVPLPRPEDAAMFPGAPAPVLDLLRNSKTPVVVVYVPMAV